MKIRLIRTTQEFKTLQKSWNALLSQNHAKSAFLTWEWLYSWWKVYESEKELWIITAWKNNDLIGVLPLQIQIETVKGFKFRVLCPLGNPLVDVSGMLIQDKDPDTIRGFSKYIIRHKSSWDMLELSHFLHDDPALLIMKEEFHASGISSREKTNRHFYLRLDNTWNEFLGKLSKGFRKNLRRAKKRAEESGSVTFEHFSGETVKWEVFEKILKINKYAQFPLLYNSQKEQALHKTLVSLDQAKNIFTIFIISIDGVPIAYEYGFTYNKRYESWRAGYDTRTNPRISIGILLLQKAIEYSFDIGYEEIDFLRGEEEYKRRWNPQSRLYTKIRFTRKANIPAAMFFIWLPKLRSKLKGLTERFVKRS